MEIGVPKETKDQEFRVGLSPSSVRVLYENGHAVFVESGLVLVLASPMKILFLLGRKLSPKLRTLGIENS